MRVNRWDAKIAPPSNDIIWKNMSNRGYISRFIKRVFILVVLLLISIILITPLTIIENINPLIEIIEHYIGTQGLIKTYTQYFMTPLCLYIFNYIMIPILIEVGISFEDRSRKCHNAKTRMRKNFFFFILNQIMLPIAGFSTIYAFFQFILSKDIEEWPHFIASKMRFSGSFFLRYIIQLSLISNTFQLLQIPKMLTKFFQTHTWYLARKKSSGDPLSLAELYKRSAVYANVERNYMDVYFDVAYNQALAISVFAMIFVFSASVPIILPFGFVYFFLKYIIDKYNIVCVYPLEFESHGYLRQTVCIFMVLSIGINQLFLIGFMLSMNRDSFKAAAFLIAVTMCVGTWYILSKKPWVPYKRDRKVTQLLPKGARKVWNHKKFDVETVNDIHVELSEVKRQTTLIMKNILSCVTLCHKCRVAESLKMMNENNELRNLK